MKKHLVRAGAFTLALCTLLSSAMAANRKQFTDIPKNHWAIEHINVLTDGGLMQGYGDGVFGPDDMLTVDQVATIICNAKGHPEGSKNGYWGYDVVDYCRNELYCLPNLGDINAANYNVACTRELAVYMLTKALGASGTAEKNDNLTKQDIPDYDKISSQYAATILQAYQLGLINGMDENGTFDPQGTLTRAQICAILNRAGITTAATKTDTKVAVGMANEDIYKEIKSWGIWKPEAGGSNGSAVSVMAEDPIYGNLEVKLLPSGMLKIVLPEQGPQVINGVWSDRFGNPMSRELLQAYGKAEDGTVLFSSAWHYEPRQLTKKILALAYPESADEAYEAMLSVMKQEIYEVPSTPYPSVIRWVDGREYKITLDRASHSMAIIIGVPGNKETYNDVLSAPSIGNRAKYVSYFGGADPSISYELDKG